MEGEPPGEPRRLTAIKLTGPAGERIAPKTWLYDALTTHAHLSPMSASLAYALVCVVLWIVLFVPLHHRRIFIKV